MEAERASGMEIYILRHGIAEEGHAGMKDADRALTGEGAKKLQAVLRRGRAAAVVPPRSVSPPARPGPAPPQKPTRPPRGGGTPAVSPGRTPGACSDGP